VAIAGADDCWPWLHSRDGKRGTFNYNGCAVTTNRAAYLLARGEIPDGLWVLHSCDNPPCCNPRHLFLGDRQANVDDAISKRRHAHGSKVGTSKLTDDQVIVIRSEYRPGLGIAIAKKYGITPQLVHLIAHGKAWKHIGGDGPPVGMARGEDNGQCKLTDDKVREARRLRREGWTLASLASRYGVGLMTIRAACLGLTWGHVANE
jgi:hypothetical protein